MPRKGIARKETDDTARFRCASGIGILREEVWVDRNERVVRFNLAFILPHVQRVDHGRVLGYDNRHGFNERHWMGTSKPSRLKGYETIRKRFLREVSDLRREYGS